MAKKQNKKKKKGNRTARSTVGNRRQHGETETESSRTGNRRSQGTTTDTDSGSRGRGELLSGPKFSPPTPDHLHIQRTPLAEDGVTQEDLNIQRALDGTDTTENEVPNTVLDVIGSGGMPLDPGVRESLEDRMGEDFSDVRIHTGAKAAEAADAIDAKAFTCGNSIVFNSGEYDPQSTEGQFLLAHELAHVKQQSGSAPLSMMPKDNAELEIDPDPQLERQADRTAEEALAGEDPVTVSRLGTDVQIQRVKKDEMFKALAVFESEDNVGEFRDTQNDRQYEFLMDAIMSYAETNGRLTEMENAADLREEIEAADEEHLDEDGKHWKEIEIPSKSEIKDARANLEESLQDSLDQIALTDEQREEVKSGMETGIWSDLSATVGATAVAALVTSSTAGGAAVSISAGMIYAYAANNWDNTSGDIEDRVQEIMEMIEADVFEVETAEGGYSEKYGGNQ